MYRDFSNFLPPGGYSNLPAVLRGPGARKALRALRFVPQMRMALAAYELYKLLQQLEPHSTYMPGYVLHCGPNQFCGPPYVNRSWWSHGGSGSPAVCTVLCSGGSLTDPNNFQSAPGTGQMNSYLEWYYATPTIARYRVRVAYRRVAPVTSPPPLVKYWPDYAPLPQRILNPPRVYPVLDPNVQKLVPKTPRPPEAPARSPQPVPPPRARWETAPGTGGKATYNLPPQNPSPPKRNERERKVKTPYGVAIFRVLDLISEGADAIGAFYDALPAATQKKWKCNDQIGGPNVGNFLAGPGSQYGVAGAKCKAEALWHNWNKVNIPKAIQNLIENEIEDRILGKAFAARDRLRPRNIRKVL